MVFLRVLCDACSHGLVVSSGMGSDDIRHSEVGVSNRLDAVARLYSVFTSTGEVHPRDLEKNN